jgi:hypothetical protein
MAKLTGFPAELTPVLSQLHKELTNPFKRVKREKKIL